jgi:pimeloyl-ACP methyl ester carboxylesterase
VKTLESQGATFAYESIGNDFMANLPQDQKPLVIWAHGWGHSHANFLPLALPFETIANHIALDFPGFGAAPTPPTSWGTEDYADAVADLLKKKNIPPVLWIGHSFGCRVGLQLAARHPERIATLCLIAGAGLKRKRPLHKKIYFYFRIKLFKLLKKFVPEGNLKQKLISKFGSADYKNAGPMRNIFIKVVNEDLTNIAKTVKCPVTLVYGQNDTETPPEFGERFKTMMPQADLFLLSDQDHYSVLSTGRHQVIKIIGDTIKNFIK